MAKRTLTPFTKDEALQARLDDLGARYDDLVALVDEATTAAQLEALGGVCRSILAELASIKAAMKAP